MLVVIPINIENQTPKGKENVRNFQTGKKPMLEK